ncbi:MAG: hypothetical protein ACRC42_01225 [Mycoplasma sp.]
MNNRTKILKTSILALTLVATLTSFSMLTISCSDAKVFIDNNSDPYGKFKTNFSESSESEDIMANNFYKNNTASIFTQNKNSSTGSMGTIWNWPNNDNSYNYFATNIHVVAEAIKYDYLSNSYYLDTSFKYSFSNDSYSYYQLKEVSIHKIFANNKIEGNVNHSNNNWYQDLVILKTKTNVFKSENTLNFLDTDAEFNWLSNSLKTSPDSLEFYIAGYPWDGFNGWPDGANWITSKYQFESEENYVNYGMIPRFSDTGSLLSNYLTNDSLGLNFGNINHKNYSLQLLLPEFNFGGGSSGSLVSVMYEGRLMPIGIYWGVYTQTSDRGTISTGGIDLFFAANDYLYANGKLTMPKYNHSPSVV